MMRTLLLSVPVLLLLAAAGCDDPTGGGRQETPPAARSLHGMIYDAARARVLLFGGRGAGGPLNDTWTWDGTRWTRVATTGPSARLEPLLTYDSNRQRVVLVGGIDAAFNRIRDMREWDGTTWTQLTAPSLPEIGRASCRERMELVVVGRI